MNVENICILTGRLSKATECRYTSSNKAVCSFSLAVKNGKDRDGKNLSVFIPCVAWGKTGELIDQYFNKGDPITVVGKIIPRSYEGKNGKGYITEVIVSDFTFPLARKTPDAEPAPVDAFKDYEDVEGELPF